MMDFIIVSFLSYVIVLEICNHTQKINVTLYVTLSQNIYENTLYYIFHICPAFYHTEN
jgi:hypothetical protein